jgi:hypothetical protein
VADLIYNGFLAGLAEGEIDLDDDDLKVMLVSSSYSPNRDSHVFRSSVTNEVTGTNWPSGGVALTGVDVTQDNTNDRAVLTADNVEEANVTVSGVRAAVLYQDTGNAATDRLIAYFDFVSDKAAAASPFIIQWHGSGILRWTQV